jgi:uronate dehydrogenase
VLSDKVKPRTCWPARLCRADLTKPDDVAGAQNADSHPSRQLLDRGTVDAILQANIIGCYNLFEAARQAGVKRVISPRPPHVGFIAQAQDRHRRHGARPDSRYGVSRHSVRR